MGCPVADFEALWEDACGELSPDPNGAAGRLVAALADSLGVEQVECEQVGSTALFLMDLSMLGFRGMDLNVVMVGHPPQNDEERRDQAHLLEDYRIAIESVGFCLYILLNDDASEPESHIGIDTKSADIIDHTAKRSLAKVLLRFGGILAKVFGREDVVCQQRCSELSTGPPSPLDHPDSYMSTSGDAVVMYRDDVSRLLRSSFPNSVLFGIIRRQRRIEQICPFSTDHEARGGMFKGRKDELTRLTQDMESNFLVTGSRRIGKTSLVRRAYDMLRIRPEYKGRVFFFNCISWGGFGDCCSRIAHQIAPRKELRIERGARNLSYLLESISARGRRPLLLFFDEVDRVVDGEASRGWPFFNVLAEASMNRWTRVVFTGYRSVSHLRIGSNTALSYMRRYSGSPFFGSLTSLFLKPLRMKEACSLLLDPFDGMSIRVRSRHAIGHHVWRNTGGHPFLIQFYGTRLFRKATTREPQEVLPGDVENIEGGRELDEFMQIHFLENTLIKGQPVNAERICAFLCAHYGTNNGWVQGDFVEKSHEVGHPLTLDEVQEALTNLVSATIFTYDRREYCFTFPVMAKILQQNYPNVSAILKGSGFGVRE